MEKIGGCESHKSKIYRLDGWCGCEKWERKKSSGLLPDFWPGWWHIWWSCGSGTEHKGTGAGGHQVLSKPLLSEALVGRPAGGVQQALELQMAARAAETEEWLAVRTPPGFQVARGRAHRMKDWNKWSLHPAEHLREEWGRRLRSNQRGRKGKQKETWGPREGTGNRLRGRRISCSSQLFLMRRNNCLTTLLGDS